MVMKSRESYHLTQLPAFTPMQMRQINRLIGEALLSKQLQTRLLTGDALLRDEFNLSPQIWQRLLCIDAHTLADFCEQLEHLQSHSVSR